MHSEHTIAISTDNRHIHTEGKSYGTSFKINIELF